jgi:hypothetical protein
LRVARVLAGAVLLVSVSLVTGPAGAAPIHPRADDLPPPTEAAIASIFDAHLAPLGLHVSRAALQQPPTYAPDPKGRHLAVYALPSGKYDTADYERNIVKVARAFLPTVFRRWKGLLSFDVCQEPLPALDSRAEPPPVTQLLVTRRGAARIDWSHVTRRALERTARAQQHHRHPDLMLYVDHTLLAEPSYQHPA